LKNAVFIDEDEIALDEPKKDLIIEKKEDLWEKERMFGIDIKKGTSLQSHQIEAIKWALKREEQRMPNGIRGGIVACDMGLGKTLITLVLTMLSSFPTLVISPKTVIYEWESNVEKFFGNKCPYLIFHREYLRDKFDSITIEDLQKYKVVITTYETVMSIVKKFNLLRNQYLIDVQNKKIGIKNCRIPVSKQTNNGNVLFAINWGRIVLDESHRICNDKSLHFKSLMALCGERKICLSGTPLRNYSTDIYSQLRFIGYRDVLIQKQFSFQIYKRENLSFYVHYRGYENTNIVLPQLNEKIIKICLKGEERQIYDYYCN